MAEDSSSCASITYLVTDLPKLKSVSEFKEYFGLKRNCGGAGEIADCEAITDNSIVLTYEKTADAPKVMEYAHEFEGEEAKLHPLLREKVTVTYQGSIEDLIDVEKEREAAMRDDLVFCYQGNKLHVEGNWYNIERFRTNIKSKMLATLKRDRSRVIQNGHKISDADNDPLRLPAGSIRLRSLSCDVLSLMQKCGVYRNDHLTYNTGNGCVMIECSGDDKTASIIAEEFQTEYRQLMMGGKLKEHSFPVPATYSKQQTEELLSRLNNDYSQSVFKYDEDNKTVKCLSMSARQLSHIKIKMKELVPEQSPTKPTIPSLSTATASSATVSSLSLAVGGRSVTLKLANIVVEEVDVIVNAANERLVHGAGVAAAINRASQGMVQQASTTLFHANGPVPTGQVVYTEAGGNLKCKYIIHAIGPEQYKHKGQCKQLLWNTCNNALQQAEKLGAESVAFPPISSGLFGLPKETVAEVLINAACSYQTQNIALIKDIRIVIIDRETFEAFIPFFESKKGEIESNRHDAFTPQPMVSISAPHHTRSYVPQRTNSWDGKFSNPPDNCPICLSPIVGKETTSCGHSYCGVCLQMALHKKSVCPLCNQMLPLTGNQPDGHMKYCTIAYHLPGYLQYGTIQITYEIPHGIQGPNHPNPGQQYTGCTRVAYLPDSPEGREVLGLLKKAFDAKLIFTIGTSQSTKRSNTVIWNSFITHKSSMDGGPNKFGYPDDGYLQNVKEQLKLKGIA